MLTKYNITGLCSPRGFRFLACNLLYFLFFFVFLYVCVSCVCCRHGEIKFIMSPKPHRAVSWSMKIISLQHGAALQHTNNIIGYAVNQEGEK